MVVATATRGGLRKPWPGFRRCLELADAALSLPPAKPHIERAEPVGDLVWRCVVPAELCVGQNQYRRLHFGQIAKLKAEVLKAMLFQHRVRKRDSVLPGRPRVHLVRFTTREPDRDAGWSKIPVDCLVRDWSTRNKKGRLTEHNGLGFLADDRPEAADVRHWWEPGKRGAGFVYVAIYTGEVRA